MKVPVRLRAQVGKRELKKAIATSSRAHAERQAIILAAQAFALFDTLEGAAPVAPFGLCPLPVQAVASVVAPLSITPPAPTVAPPAPDGSTPINEHMLLSQACDLHLKDLSKSDPLFAGARERELRGKYNRLLEIVGDHPLRDIDYYAADRYRETLTQLPRKQNSKQRQGLTAEQLIRLGDPDKISANTVNQRLQTVAALFNWLRRRNGAIANPFTGMAVKRGGSGSGYTVSALKRRQPFTSAELTRLFSDEVWLEHRHNHDWEFWLAPLLLYTGARVTELCQLLASDFGDHDGVWCLSINDEPSSDEPEDVWGWSKRVKSSNSVRQIPLHSHLIALGFRQFVEHQQGRLFADIVPIAGKLSKEPCRRYNDYLMPRTGVKAPGKSLYSLRHTTLNALKQQRITSSARGALAGHVRHSAEMEHQLLGSVDAANMTEAVYGAEFGITHMQAIVESLDFRRELAGVLSWDRFKRRPAGGFRYAAGRQRNPGTAATE
jgi:integrase